MTNRDLADTFTLVANLLEIKGEVVYVTLAYRKAAESLVSLGGDATTYWKEGKLREIPGVGKSIAEKIDELLRTGRLEFLEELEKKVPAGLAEWLQVPGLGPKKIALIWKELGITIDAGVDGCRAGRKAALPARDGSEVRVADREGDRIACPAHGRVPLGRAWPLAQQIIAALMKAPGVRKAEPAGSLRRMRPTVGDLDILVAAAEPAPVMEVFTTLPGVMRVLGSGDTKSSIEFADGVRAQVWVHPPEKFGTALQYATGSKDHNVQLRQLALEKGLSLSEHALSKTDGSGEILCATEEEVYAALGLPWIPPELREDRGEVQAAKAGKLPKLIDVGDIRADLQTHSTWSDGKLTMLELARAAARRGIKVIAFTDHSVSLGMTGGLSMERHAQQQAEIREIQQELGDSILVLHASEVEIKADGTLDYPDGFLATLDLVVASLHTGLRQERDTRHRPPGQRHPQPARGHHRPSHGTPDSRPPGGGPGHGGRPGGRRPVGRRTGDQRQPLAAGPGRYLRPARKGNGHPPQRQHGRALGGGPGHAPVRRSNCPPRLADGR